MGKCEKPFTFEPRIPPRNLFNRPRRKTGWRLDLGGIQRSMELTHHQATLRESDGLWVCSRCGLVNPSDDQPCIPVSIEPSETDSP
jgi:hypothetical protein